jgi:hypothetical protein
VFVGTDYPFLDVLWTMIVIFAWVIWFWLLITAFADLFRRKDASGVKKAGWIVFMIVAPFLGVLTYFILNADDMARRNAEQTRAAKADFDQYVQSVAASGGAAAEIERAKGLLDSGAITQAEFDAIKAKALG